MMVFGGEMAYGGPAALDISPAVCNREGPEFRQYQSIV